MNRFEFYSAKREYEEKQNSLKHYGTKGQKWGERHWQNYDGTFNEAGKERYFGKNAKRERRINKLKEQALLRRKAYNAYPLDFTDYDDQYYMKDRDWKFVKRYEEDYKKAFDKVIPNKSNLQVTVNNYGEPNLDFINDPYKEKMSEYYKKASEYTHKRMSYNYKDFRNPTDEEKEDYKHLLEEEEKWNKKYNKVKWERKNELDKYKELINKEIVKNHENNVDPKYAKELLQEMVDINTNNVNDGERFANADVKTLLSSGYAKENINPILDKYDSKKKQLDDEFDKLIPSEEKYFDDKMYNEVNLINHYFSSDSDNVIDVVKSAAGMNDKDLDIIDILKTYNKNNKNYYDEYNKLSNEARKEIIKNINKLGFNEDDVEYLADYIFNYRGTDKNGNNITNTSEKSREVKNSYRLSKDTDKEIYTEEDQNKIKNAIEQTEDISEKISKLYDIGKYKNIDFSFFKQAVNNLGYENKNMHDLSDKEWNKIYKEYEKVDKDYQIKTEKQNQIYRKKHDIYLKLENTYGEMPYYYNNWDFINEAKKNLGYDKIEDGKLTDAQWNNIKKEIIENTGKAKFEEYKKEMKKRFG